MNGDSSRAGRTAERDAGSSLGRNGGLVASLPPDNAAPAAHVVRNPLGTSYDEVPYESHPFAQTHPDRLATVATLFGMRPAPVDRCRVLELGCAAGGNLIPMALTLPGSRFVGIDLASRQIAEGWQVVEALGLDNIELRHLDLLDVDDGFGRFDYDCCQYTDPKARVPTLCPDGQQVALVSDRKLLAWDVRTGKERHFAHRHAKDINSLTFSPDGRYLASSSPDRVSIWDFATGELLRTFPGFATSPFAVSAPWALSPDARQFAWVEFDYGRQIGQVKVMDAGAGPGVRTWEGHERNPMLCRFSPDGRYLASAGLGKTVIVWDATTGQEWLGLRGPSERPVIWGIAFSPDGRRLATAGGDKIVRVWDVSPLEAPLAARDQHEE
jgi:hypothetical protein